MEKWVNCQQDPTCRNHSRERSSGGESYWNAWRSCWCVSLRRVERSACATHPKWCRQAWGFTRYFHVSVIKFPKYFPFEEIRVAVLPFQHRINIWGHPSPHIRVAWVVGLHTKDVGVDVLQSVGNLFISCNLFIYPTHFVPALIYKFSLIVFIPPILGSREKVGFLVMTPNHGSINLLDIRCDPYRRERFGIPIQKPSSLKTPVIAAYNIRRQETLLCDK